MKAIEKARKYYKTHGSNINYTKLVDLYEKAYKKLEEKNYIIENAIKLLLKKYQ